ncbi:hypothetical protein Anas_07538 [Armadillidium nasatum]|uniref:Uncharacterized protein n=1 Tax=Armadillidium nasatum TaxID=96803 RepID=A0A5N5TJ52_9CRUS|nr:hypothetical protein Anas_07538 [Armadillidium nasatum]
MNIKVKRALMMKQVYEEGDEECTVNQDDQRMCEVQKKFNVDIDFILFKQVECHENMFKCKNNKCISSLWVCDGDMDCNEGSDELDENCQCSHGQFKFVNVTRCKSGRCISQSWVCDTEEDCGPGDKSDEHENCGKFSFYFENPRFYDGGQGNHSTSYLIFGHKILVLMGYIKFAEWKPNASQRKDSRISIFRPRKPLPTSTVEHVSYNSHALPPRH